MSKFQTDADRDCGNHPYETSFFADKHGLTLMAARVVLDSNGPSRIKCDAAARAFAEAVAKRKRHWLRDMN